MERLILPGSPVIIKHTYIAETIERTMKREIATTVNDIEETGVIEKEKQAGARMSVKHH